jgi:hypothetical protein
LQAGLPDTAAAHVNHFTLHGIAPTGRERREQHQGARSAPERSTRASVGPEARSFSKTLIALRATTGR